LPAPLIRSLYLATASSSSSNIEGCGEVSSKGVEGLKAFDGMVISGGRKLGVVTDTTLFELSELDEITKLDEVEVIKSDGLELLLLLVLLLVISTSVTIVELCPRTNGTFFVSFFS
jgi:hypothetical protein